MDFSILEHFIPNVAGWLNLDPATVLLYLVMLCTVCNLIGRLIPDDVEGPWGRVRDICKIIGTYTPNRVSRGISVNDVASSIVSNRPGTARDEVVDAAVQSSSLIPEVVEQMDAEPVPDGIVPAFPGLMGKSNAMEGMDDEEDSDLRDPRR